MPLASRGTANRADRVADTAKATPPEEATQPRVKKTVPVEPPATQQEAAQTSPAAETTQAATTAPEKVRKARTPRQTAELDVGNDPKEWRKRQTAIEKEFKNLNREMAAAQREVAAKFGERRRALESEHRLLGTKLSAHVFTG